LAASGYILEEIDQISEVLRRASARHLTAGADTAAKFAERPPRLIATIGRGSSDHASTFLRYAFELTLGIPGVSIAPSIASVYGRQLQLDDALCLVVSQSGRSPDIRQAAAMARRGGATVVAIVNDERSPLAEEADFVIPIGVGPEKAVAATKSFVGSAVAGLRLLASLARDDRLNAGLDELPKLFSRPTDLPDIETVLRARTALVIGRGPALGIAQEAALKLKEIIQFPAEAFSSAEILHGPWQLADTDCALIAWASDAASQASQHGIVTAFRALGRPVLELSSDEAQSHLRHDLVEPLAPLPNFYRALAIAAQRRGLNPDRPSLLNKITETT
jgi:glucosamine--fructose-6-phosphate aminotransferase (isomerizing)